ncbi:MAG: PQQ-binding-like beta-propeller repeat protein [Verrucomicrobiota bacterium]
MFRLLIHLPLLALHVAAADWPLFGRDSTRDPVSPPVVANGLVWIGTSNDKQASILALFKQKPLLARNFMCQWIASSPIFANGVLNLAAADTLYTTGSHASADWPQWRGADRSNVSKATGLLTAWPTNGPPLLWKVMGMGTGIASVSVADERVYTTGFREGTEWVYALDAGTGQILWISPIGPAVDESPLMRWLSQRTPTVDADRVYVFSASGNLICLNRADGSRVWQKSYPDEFLAPRRMWGYCDFPMVDGERLIGCPGAPGATVVAFNKRTGEVVWKSDLSREDGASYAAIVRSDAGGIRQYVAFLSKGLAGLAAEDGRVLWRYHGTAARQANSYTPIVSGDLVFSANGYGGGMASIELLPQESGFKVKERYYRSFAFNPFQDSTARVGDHVYGFQAPGKPVCIEMLTGNLAWGPIENAAKDRAALTCAEGHLYIRRASGAMILAEATPVAYKENGSFQIPDREEAAGVTAPVVAGRRLYLRDNTQLLCYDIAADAFEKPRREPNLVQVGLPVNRVKAQSASTPGIGRDRAPDAIYVPTPDDIVEKMLQLAKVKKEEVVYDLGSGDGRIVLAAARQYGCKAVGYEIDPRLVKEAREHAAIPHDGV